MVRRDSVWVLVLGLGCLFGCPGAQVDGPGMDQQTTMSDLRLLGDVDLKPNLDLVQANGGSMQFSGAQTLTLTNVGSLVIADGWTVEFWYKQRAADKPPNLHDDGLFRQRSGENGSGLNIKTSGVIGVQAGSGAFDQAVGNIDHSDGIWHHVAVVFGPMAKLYVDGALEATLTISTISPPMAPLYIGSYGQNEFFTGYLDEFRIWDNERTQAEIQGNSRKELSGSEQHLRAYWKFNQSPADVTANHYLLSNPNGAAFATDTPF